GGSAGLFCADRERANADRPERAHAKDRNADSDEVSRRTRVTEFLARWPPRRVFRHARRDAGYLHRRSRIARYRQPHNRRFLRLRSRLFSRWEVPGIYRPDQRKPEAVPPRSRHEEENAADLRHQRRDTGAVRG